MSDLNFEKLLEEHNQAYAEAEVFDDWMPPHNEYVVVLKKPKSGIMEKKGANVPWWSLTGTIQEPNNKDLDDRDFRIGFYSGTAKTYGFLKGAASILAGRKIATLKEANEVINNSEAYVLKVRVGSRTDNDGNTYPDVKILEVIDRPGEAPAEEVATE